MSERLKILLLLLIATFSTPLLVNAESVVLDWNTFLGCTDTDRGKAVAVDSSGNVYITGYSYASWGAPINTYTGNSEGFLAKYDPDGNHLWLTFMGCASVDWAMALAVDNEGNVYVAGTSFGTWGSPVNPYGGGFADGFLAKFDPDGNRLWNTFLGGSSGDYAYAVALDPSGSPCVAGLSGATWGSPVNPYTVLNDAYVAKFNANGQRVWNTFLGGSGQQQAQGLVISPNGEIAVTGKTNSSWAAANLLDYSGGEDAFVSALSASGAFLWNTYLGGMGNDQGTAITVDSHGDFLVLGCSTATWGSPITAHSGSGDAFVAKIDAQDGGMAWNTFIGGSGTEYGYALTLDPEDNLFITGYSASPWGTPLHEHSGVDDLFIAALFSSGHYYQHTFYGSNDYDDARGIAYDTDHQALWVSGYAKKTWGTPLTSYAGGSYDAFLLKLVPSYTIHFDADMNGHISGNTTQTLKPGQCNSAVTAIPDDGYMLKYWNGEGFGISTENPLTICDVHSDLNLTAQFTRIMFTVSARVDGGHGTVSPAGQSVLPGGKATVQITPDTGYSLVSLTDNGKAVNPTTPYTIGNIQGNHVLVAMFGNEEPVVTITSPTGGSIVSGQVSVTALVNDDLGISSVTFSVDGREINRNQVQKSRSPKTSGIDLASESTRFTFTWDSSGYSSGSHTLSVTASDEAGTSGSDSVTVSLQNLQLNLSAERHSVRAWSIRRDYADIALSVRNSGSQVSLYRLLRQTGGGSFATLAELGSDDTSYRDKYLEPGQSYSYRMEALDSSGNILAQSNEVTL